jgi:hypothetical protein
MSPKQGTLKDALNLRIPSDFRARVERLHRHEIGRAGSMGSAIKIAHVWREVISRGLLQMERARGLQ